jgi:hypothetical protein
MKMFKVNMNSEYMGRVEEWGQKMDLWKVVLKYKGKRFTVPFYMGIGYDGREPELGNVLDSLFRDTQVSDYNFDDFVKEFGYENDNKLGKEGYASCLKNTKGLKRLFGNEFDKAYEHFLE